MLLYSSDLDVELIHHYGEDRHIADAAWVSSGRGQTEPSEKRVQGIINALLRDKHGTPFESGYFAFLFNVPRAVRDEVVRHRMLSISSSSLRYSMGQPKVYIPPRNRPFKKAEGFKQIQPVYEALSDQEYALLVEDLKQGYGHANYHNHEIQQYIESTEAARWLTHDGTYVTFIARMNPRSLMHFLSLRTHNKDANHVSYPMWEIETVALKMEKEFADKLPMTYKAWQEYGRESP